MNIVTMARQNKTETCLFPLLKGCVRWRKIVDTVGTHLTERMALAHRST